MPTLECVNDITNQNNLCLLNLKLNRIEWLIMYDLELETAKYKHRHDLVDKGHVDRFIIHLTINYDMPFYDQLIYTRYKI